MGERLTQFGAQCTGDHLIRQRCLDSEEDAELEGASSALMLYDRGPTGWIFTQLQQGRLTTPPKHSSSGLDLRKKAQSSHCDNAHELIGAARKRGWRCATATTGVPRRPCRTHGPKNKEGGRCSIVQPGLDCKWWPMGTGEFTTLAVLMEIPPYNWRHGKGDYTGGAYPFFGAFVSFMPQPESLKKRDAFESKTMWGIFVGYYVAPGGCTQVTT